MLARATFKRGMRKTDLPAGECQRTGFRTQHPLRPEGKMVEEYLSDPSPKAWKKLERDYLALIETRFKRDRTPYDELAELARTTDVYLLCSCPTQKNLRPAATNKPESRTRSTDISESSRPTQKPKH